METVRLYTDLATNYNRRFDGSSGQFLYETDRRIIRDFLSGVFVKNVVDVPVGTGRVLEYLRDLDLEVLGVDMTEEMLAQARSVATEPKQQVTLGNAADLPVPDEAVDCVISLRFFHLFPRTERQVFAQEFSRILRPGGYALVSFTNGGYCGGINWLKRLCGRKTVYFQYPGEVKKLFPGWKCLRLEGNFLPKQYILAKVPLVARAAEWFTAHFPGNLVCWERFYLLQKPE